MSKAFATAGYLGLFGFLFDFLSKHYDSLDSIYKGLLIILVASTIAGFCEVMYFNEMTLSKFKYKIIKWLLYISALMMGYGLELASGVVLATESVAVSVIVVEFGFMLVILDRFGLPVVPDFIKGIIEDFKNRFKKDKKENMKNEGDNL